jgi:hypothetical protein
MHWKMEMKVTGLGSTVRKCKIGQGSSWTIVPEQQKQQKGIGEAYA